jgi:hypothetical protein
METPTAIAAVHAREILDTARGGGYCRAIDFLAANI